MEYFVSAARLFFLLISLLNISAAVENESDLSQTKNTNCYIRRHNNVVCFGHFNLSEFLRIKRRVSDDDGSSTNIKKSWDSQLNGLEIHNSTIETFDENTFQFYGYTFRIILLQNMSHLHYIHPKAFIAVKDSLTVFRAVGTKLPPYNEYGNAPFPASAENPFELFTLMNEVYVGEQSYCPEDQYLFWPCECVFGHLWYQEATGLYLSSSQREPALGQRTEISCRNDHMSATDFSAIFQKISQSNHGPKHFDVLKLSGKNITNLPANVFSNVSFTMIWMENMNNLRRVSRDAFISSKNAAVGRSIQLVQIENANFTAANKVEVADIFEAFSSLINIRKLLLNSCGLPGVPPQAFSPKNGQLLNNLRYLSLSFDRRKHPSGLSSVGSFAFSGAPNLIGLGLSRNFMERFDSYAFAFNQTSNSSLDIDIGGNPFNDSTGLSPNAFSGARRPLHIKFEVDSFAASDPANDPSFHSFPENVFRPFIAENSDNYLKVDAYNVDVWCDNKIKWMFEDNGVLKEEVQRALRIKRIEDNFVADEPQSILCKPESSFEELPNCLVFPSSGLVHCGGNGAFDVEKEFERLTNSIETGKITKLIFSATNIREIPENSFRSFRFKQVRFSGCRNLSIIHPNAFGDGARSITRFFAANTSLSNYPNFAKFPNLKKIQLDDFNPYHIGSSSFDYTEFESTKLDHTFTTMDEMADSVDNVLHISLDNGTIEPDTFTKMNGTAVALNIGQHRDCDTTACLFNCKPTKLKLEAKIFKPFLDSNPKNTMSTKCYLECSCELKWMYESWATIRSQTNIWISEYFGTRFYCVPPGVNLKTKKNFFGVDTSKFDYAEYFSKNCS